MTSQHGTPAQRPGSPPPGRNNTPRLPRWAWWLIFAVLIAWNALIFLGPSGQPGAKLPYSAFIAQVRQDNVASVDISGQQIQGAFRRETAWPPPSPSPGPSPSPAATPAATPAPTASGSGTTTYQKFATVMPAFGDPELLALLESHGVTVKVENTTGGIDWLAILSLVLPMLLLVGLMVYLGRQVQRSQAGIFRFGGSRARLYDVQRPGVTFADVAGEEEAKAELTEVVDFLKAPERYRQIGARLPRGVLLVGPPGTGKTLLARAVAGEAGVPFFSITASEFVEMFVGVGASRVRDLFEKAKSSAPAIVFVDEIDAVGRQRGTGLGGGNDEREQTLNQLLSEMDGFDETTNVIVMAATNRPDVLDPALLRPGRFDRHVTVGYPDRAGREAILAIHTKNLRLEPSVDLHAIAQATGGFSGADLANLANEAALMAARARKTLVGPEHFEEALDKVLLGTKQSGLTNADERRAVAYHEGGHAIVARLTAGADPVQKVTIVPHGLALGVTQQRPEEDRRNYPRDYLLARLTVMLAGRAAEEVALSQATSGAENDLKQATDLARRMVGVWGMSPDLGPVNYGVGETHPFLGRELAAPREYADATAARIDAAVLSLIDGAHSRATTVIVEHRAALDTLATELQAHEVVSAQRLDEILSTSSEDEAPGHEATSAAQGEEPD